MQFRQLEYLVALAKEQHFARAASTCFVSQPTLSDGIRHLESELGVTIVQRGHRFEGFTPEGERVLEFARRLAHEREDLLSQLGPNGDTDLSGRLRVGAIPTSLPALPLITIPFLDRFPNVALTVRSASSAQIDRELRSFELDVGITYVELVPIESVRALPLYEEEHFLLAAETMLAGEQDKATWEEASAMPLCLLTPDMQNRQIVDRLFEQAGFVSAPRVETNSVSALFAHVTSGRFASVVPQSWLLPFGTPAGTRALRFAGGDAPSTIGLVWLDIEPEPLLARALLSVVRSLKLQPTLDNILTISDAPTPDAL